MKLKQISLFLVFVMLLTIFSSACSDSTGGGEDSAESSSVVTQAPVTQGTDTDGNDESENSVGTESTETNNTSEEENSQSEGAESEESKPAESKPEVTDPEEIETDGTEPEVTDSEEIETDSTEPETTKFEDTETEESTTEETEMITDVMIGETLDAEYASNFTVAKIFSNDMVVQRGEHIRVWGFAPESENGKKVSGEFKGMFAEAIIENGEWCITFTARLEADTNGAQMKIYTDKKTVTFDGVLVGDVYLVLGQSNAAYTVSNHLAYNDPLTQGGSKNDIDPNSIIRLNRLNGSGGGYGEKGTDYVYSDLENTKFWVKTTQSETLSFSALGYYFAVQMVEKNPNIPIGLMQVAVGGAPIVSFLPNDLAEKWEGDYYDNASGTYLSNVNATHMGRYLYNCYLAPVQNYAVAGVLWYQGESNNEITESIKYNATFADLMTRLRETHNVVNKNFPIFIVEFPSIYRKPADYSETWHFMELGMIRSYMGSIPTILKNSYVSVSSDLWADDTFYNNLHPNCKYEQAARIAALAEVVINQKGTLEAATGPIFNRVKISNDKKTVIITFTNVGDGLKTADGGNEVLGIVGLDDNYMGHTIVQPVSATITAKNQITVVFDTEVKAVAYNYVSDNFYGEEINLCNSFGNPAAAFLSSYTEKELGEYTADNFKTTSFSRVKFRKRAIDTLTANGKNLFTVGNVTAELAAAGNRVEIPEGTARVSTYGWIGFDYPIIMFGYSIDGGNAVFNTYPSSATQAVINAGGQYAKRFSVNVPTGELSVGEHTVDILVLVNVSDGIAVKFFSFTLAVTEAVEEQPSQTPAGYDAPSVKDDGYGFCNWSLDALNKMDASNTGTSCFGNGVRVEAGLAECKNTITVTPKTKKLRLYGWMGFSTTLDMFGYAIDGNATLTTSPGGTHEDIIASGGENAKRFDIFVDISGLEAGTHTIDYLVRINMPDGTKAVLKIISVTLIIEGSQDSEESKVPNGYDAPIYNTAGFGYKGYSVDLLQKDGTDIYRGGVVSKLKADGSTVTITKGVKNIYLYGWIGYETAIDKLGYALDGVATIETAPSNAEQGVINAGGDLAKRFNVYADISGLDVGYHTVDLLVRINTADGNTAVLKILSFTLIIEE